jgi:hypothetical protein
VLRTVRAQKITLIVLAAVALQFCGVPALAAAPRADLWPRWQANDPGSKVRVDHSEWAKFLEKFLVEEKDGINRVAYGAVGVEDLRRLGTYIALLAAAPVSRLRRDEQFAYWINLYNALTVKVILDHYPVASILEVNISPGWFTFGPWDKKLLVVEGEKISLNDIEHRILRPIWRDPRIHYAVNCASLGCPNLAPVPWTAGRAGEMLDEAARAYVNHPRGARFGGWGLIVSSIFHWYQADFGGTEAGVIRHLRKYAAPALADRLGRAERIHNHGYDWRLNLARTGGAPKKVN